MIRDPNVNARIDRLTRDVERLESQLAKSREVTAYTPMQPRLAITVLDSGSSPTYPTSTGNPSGTKYGVYPIKFVDAAHDAVVGWITALTADRQGSADFSVRAMSIGNDWIPSGTLVAAFKQERVDATAPGKWYIVPIPSVGELDRGQILIRNDTGGDVGAHQVLQLNGPVTTAISDLAAYKEFPPTFKGITPTDKWGEYVVTLEAIDEDDTGRCCLNGVCVVELTDPATVEPWLYVDIQNASTKGKEYWYGAGKILDVDTRTADTPDTRWATIDLQGFQAPIYKATADESIASGATGDATLIFDGTNQDTITVHNKWMEGSHTIALNDEIMVFFDPGQGWWRPVAVEC